MQPRLATLIAPVARLAVGAAPPSATSPLQEHPAGSHNVHLLGRVPLAAAPARLGAVAALGDVAYAAVSAGPSCGGAGIQAVSVADPSAPARLSFVRASAGTSIEGAIDAIRLDTPDFR